MTNHKITAIAIAALFSLGLMSASTPALAQATPATPPAKADKGQAMKQKQAETDKGKAKGAEQGKKKGAEKGKKTGQAKKAS